MMEKAINFKVSGDFYKEIKIKVATDGKTIKDYVIQLIKKDLQSDK